MKETYIYFYGWKFNLAVVSPRNSPYFDNHDSLLSMWVKKKCTIPEQTHTCTHKIKLNLWGIIFLNKTKICNQIYWGGGGILFMVIRICWSDLKINSTHLVTTSSLTSFATGALYSMSPPLYKSIRGADKGCLETWERESFSRENEDISVNSFRIK